MPNSERETYPPSEGRMAALGFFMHDFHLENPASEIPEIPEIPFWA
jgi:hypothetical protein